MYSSISKQPCEWPIKIKFLRFNLINTCSNHSEIFSMLFKQGPSEFPCPGKSIERTLKFLFEKNCSVKDQTICERPLQCKKTIVFSTFLATEAYKKSLKRPK